MAESSRTSLFPGCIIHGPCNIGHGCFIGFKAAIFNAKLGDGVFVNTGVVVQGVDLVANALVPPIVAVLSGEDIVKLVSTTSPSDRKFMEKNRKRKLGPGKRIPSTCQARIKRTL